MEFPFEVAMLLRAEAKKRRVIPFPALLSSRLPSVGIR